MALSSKVRREAMREVAKTVRLIPVAPPPKPKRGFWRDYVFNSQNFFSTLSIFGLIAIIVFSPGNIEIFDPIQRALTDFSFTDIVYSQWRNDDAVVEDNIILVNLGRNRAEVAHQIKVLSAMQPKVIGVDAVFSTEKEPDVDLALIDALSTSVPIVLASRIDGWKGDSTKPMYTELSPPHPKFMYGKNVSHGHNALVADKENKDLQTLRTFEPQVQYKDTTITSFTLEVAERWKPGMVKEMLARGNDDELINFRGNYNKFLLVDIDFSVPIDSAITLYSTSIKGKIVLLGYMGQPFDNPNDVRGKVYTPASKTYVGKSVPDMYNTVVQANIISMMIRNEMITQMPQWLGYVIAVVVCYLNMALFNWVTMRFPSFAGGEMKVIQLFQSGLVVLGAMYSLYNIRYSMEISLTLAVILLASDVLEIHESSVKRMLERIKETQR
jgi:CHASE2 domain-containing sensor protein